MVSFSNYMIDVINKGSLSLMLSIGHRTKLFDVMSTLSLSTVEDIALSSKLNRRYIKEWLGAMVTGKIVECDPTSNKYWLSDDKAKYLTRENNIYNFAASMQWVPILAQVEDEIVECFTKGGGVPYSSYKRFHDVMSEESYQTVVVGLIDHILPLVPNLLLNLKQGIKVLDIGCGKGKAVTLMAQHFPNSIFYGYDLSKEAIDDAIKEAKDLKISNAFFKTDDILDLTFKEKFDLIENTKTLGRFFAT